MHLSDLLRSKIWRSLRIPTAPSLMASFPLEVDTVSLHLASLNDSCVLKRLRGLSYKRGGEHGDTMTTSVCNWNKWLDLFGFIRLLVNVRWTRNEIYFGSSSNVIDWFKTSVSNTYVFSQEYYFWLIPKQVTSILCKSTW